MAEAKSLNVAPSQQGTKTWDAATQAFQGAKDQGSVSQQQQANKGLSYGTGTQLQGSTNVGSATPHKTLSPAKANPQGSKTLSAANANPQRSKSYDFATSQLHGTRSDGFVTPQQQGPKTVGAANTQLQDAKSLDFASSQLQRAKSVGPSTPQVQGARSLPPSGSYPQGAKHNGYGATQTQGSKNPNPVGSSSQAQGQVSQEPDRTQISVSVALPGQEAKSYFSTSGMQMHSSKSYNFVASSAKSSSSASSYSITQGSKGPVAAPVQEAPPAASVSADDTRPYYDDIILAQDRTSLDSAAVAPEQGGKTAPSFNPGLDVAPMVPEVSGKSIWSASTAAQAGQGLGSQPVQGKSMGPYVPGQQEGKSQGAATPNTGAFLPTYQGNPPLVPLCVCPRDLTSRCSSVSLSLRLSLSCLWSISSWCKGALCQGTCLYLYDLVCVNPC